MRGWKFTVILTLAVLSMNANAKARNSSPPTRELKGIAHVYTHMYQFLPLADYTPKPENIHDSPSVSVDDLAAGCPG